MPVGSDVGTEVYTLEGVPGGASVGETYAVEVLVALRPSAHRLNRRSPLGLCSMLVRSPDPIPRPVDGGEYAAKLLIKYDALFPVYGVDGVWGVCGVCGVGGVGGAGLP